MCLSCISACSQTSRVPTCATKLLDCGTAPDGKTAMPKGSGQWMMGSWVLPWLEPCPKGTSYVLPNGTHGFQFASRHSGEELMALAHPLLFFSLEIHPLPDYLNQSSGSQQNFPPAEKICGRLLMRTSRYLSSLSRPSLSRRLSHHIISYGVHNAYKQVLP